MNREFLFLMGGGGLLVLAVALVCWWSDWRKKSIAAAGGAFGFRKCADDETLFLPPVPLVERSKKSCLLIMRGLLGGYEAAYFDLLCYSGKNWDYQSAIMLSHPQAMMPKFQLRRTQWLEASQSSCREAVEISGRESDMECLRLSSDDPQWARRAFMKASPEFFQKLREGKWTVEGFQRSVVVYRWGTRIAARELRGYVEQAGELAAETFLLGDRT